MYELCAIPVDNKYWNGSASDEARSEQFALVKRASELFAGFIQSDFVDPDSGDSHHTVSVNLTDNTAERVFYLSPIYTSEQATAYRINKVTLGDYLKRLQEAAEIFGENAKLAGGFFGNSLSFREWVPLTDEQLQLVEDYQAWNVKRKQEYDALQKEVRLERLHYNANELGFTLVPK